MRISSLTSKEISITVKTGRAFATEIARAKMARSKRAGLRTAIIVGKKTAALAVSRNRIKRIFREALRKYKIADTGFDFVLMPRPIAKSKKSADAEIFIDKALKYYGARFEKADN